MSARCRPPLRPRDAEPKTLEEIGRRLGLTRERVRQIEVEALQRLATLHEMESVAADLEDGSRLRGRAASPGATRPQLAQRARLELAHALAGDAEPAPTSSSVSGGSPSRPKRRSTTYCMRGSSARAPRELRERGVVAVCAAGDRSGRPRQVGDDALAVADRRLEVTGSSTRSNSSSIRSSVKPRVLRDLLERRVAVELLRELAA